MGGNCPLRSMISSCHYLHESASQLKLPLTLGSPLEHQCPRSDSIMNYKVIQSSDLQPIAPVYSPLHFLCKPHISATRAQGHLTVMSHSIKALWLECHSDSELSNRPDSLQSVTSLFNSRTFPDLHKPIASTPVYLPDTLH